MKTRISAVLTSLRELADLYGELMACQTGEIDGLLTSDVESAQRSRVASEALVARVHEAQAKLAEGLSEGSLPSLLAELDSDQRRAADELVLELSKSIRRLQSLIWRQRRFIQNSMAYSQALLQQILGNSSCYDGDGMVRAKGKRSSQEGMRV